MNEKSFQTVMMKLEDNVAIALAPLEAGSKLVVECEAHHFQVTLTDSIEFGHKFAMKEIPMGEDVIKYGEVIGSASQTIQVGQHVHIHNVEGKRGRGDKVAEA